MYQEVNRYVFQDAFADCNRKDNFSYEGLNALFDYLEEYEESTGEKIELDVIALCCEYTEYADFTEFQRDYSNIETMEELEDRTQVIKLEQEGFIIQQF